MVVCATNAGTSAVITKKRGKGDIITIPEIIERYRKFMRGIDMFDQNMTYYSYPHRTIKWWKNCFFYFLEIALNNSYILYKNRMISLNQKFLSYDKYRIQIAVSLCEKSKARRENKTVINQAISGIHWIIKIENTKECIG